MDHGISIQMQVEIGPMSKLLVTTQMNEMNILEDLVNQVQKWPVSVALVIALAFTGIVLKRIGMFPNKFIPAVLMILSTCIYILVGESGVVNPVVKYPDVVLGLYGWILGMIGWLAQGIIWKFIILKLPVDYTNGDTTLYDKPKDGEK